MHFYLCAIFLQNANYSIHLSFYVQIIYMFFINHTLKFKYPPHQMRINANDQQGSVAAYPFFVKNSTGSLRLDEAEECATSGQTLYRGVIEEDESHKKMDEDGALLRLNPNVTG